MTMANSPDRTDAIETFSFAQGVILAALVLASVAWFTFLGRQLSWPIEPGYSPSILASMHPLRGFITVIVGSAVCAFVGSLFLGRIKPDAGLMLAACGLARLAAVAGPVGSSVGPGASDWGHAWGIEPAFFLVMLLGWYGLRLLGRIGLVRRWPASTDSGYLGHRSQRRASGTGGGSAWMKQDRRIRVPVLRWWRNIGRRRAILSRRGARNRNPTAPRESSHRHKHNR